MGIELVLLLLLFQLKPLRSLADQHHHYPLPRISLVAELEGTRSLTLPNRTNP
ncbi:hypothetical protein BJP36_42305 [Moorena producens JHB]|uniref:Uncharacterized protein n=1 Tax=Moorena producens (strain JHB) TaxID=1454205 RepID=A0A9Q9SSV5_MOOP1|nr:hypothetical protein [Moorena producens]WAN68998.1 hypothetical protein BJP36_42305 [Moorena producens JHB]